MDVARATGCTAIVLSTGRTSEKAVQKLFSLPEEAYAMMGDYLEFSLLESAAHDFRQIHLAAMWAKVLKAAMGMSAGFELVGRTRREKIRMIGNAVCPPVMEAVIRTLTRREATNG